MCWLDPEVGDARRELVGAHVGADAVPARGFPQLNVVRCTDYHRFRLQAAEPAQAGRQDQPTLAVQLDLERAGEEEARERSGSSIGIALRAGRVGQLVPCLVGKDGDTVLEPAAHRRVRGRAGPKASGHGYTALAVDGVTELAGEHTATSWSLAGSGVVTTRACEFVPKRVPGWDLLRLFPHFGPLWATPWDHRSGSSHVKPQIPHAEGPAAPVRR